VTVALTTAKKAEDESRSLAERRRQKLENEKTDLIREENQLFALREEVAKLQKEKEENFQKEVSERYYRIEKMQKQRDEEVRVRFRVRVR
jgi:DNA repair exonuclease SbcCD ATPase subunit